ncbi:GCN5 family acetyltransferase [Frateuria sp. Soil773]|uniref:GNAT family N-acetyltransferase n=1 Tax=Frateuria sp. Soil773 TaxID=1736407 RepID=UPI0006FF7E31|nr:GNAT family protein [Frateuria sp. Soil773]KRF00358.1 GCN5 family acetyltransferase [Frateuria sp. Soil773]
MAALPEIALRTARLRTRLLTEADVPALLEMYADPVVMRYWSHAPWTGPDQAMQMLARDRAQREQGEGLRLGVEHLADGRVIGTLALFNLSPSNRRAEIGYAQARRYWGQGLMHEILHAYVGHLFDAMALHRLEADIDPRNTASARSLERLGFRKEGHLRERWIVDGEISDTALYGLLRSEWKAAPG